MSSRVNYPRFPIQDTNAAAFRSAIEAEKKDAATIGSWTRPSTSFYSWEEDLPVNWIPNLWLVFMIFPLCMFLGCLCSRLKLQREIAMAGTQVHFKRVLYRRPVRIYRSNGEDEEEATIWI